MNRLLSREQAAELESKKSGNDAASSELRFNPWERSDRKTAAILEIDEAQRAAENDASEHLSGALPPELPGLAKASVWGPVGFDAAELMLERIGGER